MERDRFMTPEEAREFGLIDHVVEQRQPADTAGDEGNDTDEGS
jgi:ATP-dependent Clp protease protease subunit